jgi:spore coat protein CotH
MTFKQLCFLTGLVWVSSACKEPNLDSAVDTSDWTTQSHSNEVAPNYDVVFPQSAVNTIEIRMTSSDWQRVRSDMQSKYGSDFGSGGTTITMPINGTPILGMPGSGTPTVGMPGNGSATIGVPGNGMSFGSGEPDYIAVSLTYGGKQWSKVGFRLKGNSTLSSAWRNGNYKLPFRLNMDEFEDQYSAIANQRFYGFKELSFSPGANDNSLIREKVTADIFRAAGVPAAQTAFYQVYIDIGEGLKYCGVYTAVEVIDDSMVRSQFGEKTGNMYKPESTFAQFTQSEFEKKNNKDAGDYSDIQSTITTLNSSERTTNPASWRTALEKNFNADHFIKWLAINTAMVNWDSYGTMAHNYYLYNDPGKGLTWIPWDHNEALRGGGTGGMGQGLSLSLSEVTNRWPLIRYLMDDSVYQARYKAYMKQFVENVFTTAKMNELFERNSNLISPYVIGPKATEQSKYTYLTSSSAFTQELSSLKQHVATRNQLVAAYLK